MCNQEISIQIKSGTDIETVIYRVKRDSILHIYPEINLLGCEIILQTNYPIKGEKFNRTSSRILHWFQKDGQQITSDKYPSVYVVDTDIYAKIHLQISGTFKFWFSEKNNNDNDNEIVHGLLYVQVEPTLFVGKTGIEKSIPLDAVRCQTVISKLLGSIDTWESKLRVTKESGYNMIHFTPIQSLGASGSAYSIRDQLKVNPNFANSKEDVITFNDVAEVIKKCRQEWGIASICDIVLNHTANESEWLFLYPEVAYSCAICPYLRPAFLFDAMLAQCGSDIVNGVLEKYGVPPIINTENHLAALKQQLYHVYLPQIKLYEMFQCDVEKLVKHFIELIENQPSPTVLRKESCKKDVQLVDNLTYIRFGAQIDMNQAIKIFDLLHIDCFDEKSRIAKCAYMFRQHLQHLNEEMRIKIQKYVDQAINNCLATIRYERIEETGPKIREINDKHKVFMEYFTRTLALGKTLIELEMDMYNKMGNYFMAHNGWVIGGNNVLENFAEKQCGYNNVYFKRELIAWGDSVKLRYGKKPDDNMYLWQHMTEYVVTTARIFDGIRLDNCHSTPLHVAEYLLDAARNVNPNLYVVAELFTNSDSTDNVFVNRLGISSIIREAMSAWDSHEQGRLVYRYGGSPVGAFITHPERDLSSSIAHAMFLDWTHDNPSPIEKRTVYDLLPSSALVAMASCATGSNRGYDELVPHHIHVVEEERQYQEWAKHVNMTTGIIAAKRILNLLHGQLAEEGFTQIFVDQVNTNVVAITRHSPKTHQSVILVAYTAFSYSVLEFEQPKLNPLCFQGRFEEIILEAELHTKDGKTFQPHLKNFHRDPHYINGYDNFQLRIQEHIQLDESKIFDNHIIEESNLTKLHFVNMKPGSIAIIRVSLNDHVHNHVNIIQNIIKSLSCTNEGTVFNDLKNILDRFDLVDLSYILFVCHQEEATNDPEGGSYDIPGGPLVYCGFQGIMSVLTEITPSNNLGHSLCDNLREGNWLIDYIVNRLKRRSNTEHLAEWLENIFRHLKSIPRYLLPCYFDAVISGIYKRLLVRVYELMTAYIQNAHNFDKLMALATLQFLAPCTSAKLPQLSPNLSLLKSLTNYVTLSAGLPHFSSGFMRCWGRDTFISIRGLLYLTGRYNEARYIILAFGQCMRHGLIPNLLADGQNPRYNCRDAVWWWLHSIKHFVLEAPNGYKILEDQVSRIFPSDDSEPAIAGKFDQTLIDVMQESLEVHFRGLKYRERNAGPQIDVYMTDKGFNNQIGVNTETGFVFGGNAFNCGTWMDKMGSSEKAGNLGQPTTPRDGSAVELIGLQYAVLKFMQSMYEKQIIKYNSVTRKNINGETIIWTYKEWTDRIAQNFEKHFFISNMDNSNNVNKRNIYKDCNGSSQTWADYQLRCNFPISMVIAPELFNAKNAWLALENVRRFLLGPLGVKTLDPDDWNYCGWYNTNDDSLNGKIAHGANYHQGPEWIWPMGFYLRARLIFAEKLGYLNDTIKETLIILRVHLRELQTSYWRGLPELTNENGCFCLNSCPTQAWSVATIMETLYDLRQLERKHLS